jgi:PEP-CTERM motif
MRGVSAIFVGSKRWATAVIVASAVTFGSASAFDWGEPIRTSVVTPPPIPPETTPLPPDVGPPDSNPTSPSEAPEPATLTLALAGAAMLLVRRRK